MRNSSPVSAGQTIANKYLVEGVLGEGGMGVVISAWHIGLEQRVAIKLLLRERLQHDESAIERFQREARAAARIRSQHVCRVIDTGALEDGTPFLVMEYLEGKDLADELTQRGRLPVSEAVGIVREACEALAEAHAAGIIHRDLKPANMFLVQRTDGSRLLKVLDFGVSKSLSGSGTPHRTLTKTASLVGSPIYMSPEQLNSSRDVDARTDIWALGIILYELITGTTPFNGDSIPQLVNAVLNTQAASFASLNVSVPAGLEEVVARALSKPREQRFASAQELSNALQRYAPKSSQVTVSRTVVVSSNPPPPRASLEAPQARDSQRASANRALESRQPEAAAAWSARRWALLIVLLIAGAGLSAAVSRRWGIGNQGGQGDVARVATGADAGTPQQALSETSSRASPGLGAETQQQLPTMAPQAAPPQAQAATTDTEPVPPAVVPVDERVFEVGGSAPGQNSVAARDKPRKPRDEHRAKTTSAAPAAPASVGTAAPEAAAKITHDTGAPGTISNFGGRR